MFKFSTQIIRISTRGLSRSMQKPRPEGKHYRLWKVPGDSVLRKDLLARQYLMQFHPGLNVGINHERDLYALCDGVMILTEETFNPDWSFKLTEQIYKSSEGGEINVPSHQVYLHVIPKKRISEFKLIDLV